MITSKQLQIDFNQNIGEESLNNTLLPGTIIRSKSSGKIGTIIKFGNRFGIGNKAYNAYYVNWSNGSTGYPNESDFEVVIINQDKINNT